MIFKEKALSGLAQIAVLCAAIGLIYIYPFLSLRLSVEGLVQSVIFKISYGLTLVALLGIAITIPSWLAYCATLVRRMPIRSVLLVINYLALLVVVFTIFTQWGVIAMMLFTSLICLRYVLLRGERRQKAMTDVVRISCVSFWMFFLALGAGEVYFRFNPEQVGGGGGGNPALRQIYKGLYSINSHGLRDDEFPLKPAKNESRILMLGDSFTYGQGVAFENTFPQHTERLLNDVYKNRNINVINAGKCGSNTTWQLEYLKNKGWEFDPDLVVLQFYSNDIELTTDPKEHSQNQILEVFFRRPLWRSYVVFFLRYNFDRFITSLYVDADDHTPKDWLWSHAWHIEHNTPAWQECKQSLQNFAELCKVKGVPAMAVLYPHPGEPHDAIPVIHEAVRKTCIKAKLPCLDLLDTARKIESKKQMATEFDHHPSGEFHALAAESFVEWLRERLPPL